MDENDLIKRFRYYRETQIWPLAKEFNYEQWLNNFTKDEKEIAKQILDYFIYIPDGFINQMFATVLGKCGYLFKRLLGSWSDNDFKNNCWYSFIPGEENKPTDSGYLFERKLRDDIHIPETQILDYFDLYLKLMSTSYQNVILVDDFVGSGHQTTVAWQKLLKYGSLQYIALTHHHNVIYAPLIVNKIGFDLINSKCAGLNLVYIYLLGEEYSLFNLDCPCWNGNYESYINGTKLILEKSKELGIPFTNGNDVIDVRGYREQGLALAFKHGIPDACPPIFYWETETWKPLIKKVYKRPTI